MISVATGKLPRDLKDTSQNIKEIRESCVFILSEPFLKAANFTSLDSSYDVDEWALFSLGRTVRSSHVAESAFSVERKVTHCLPKLKTEGFCSYLNDPMKAITEKLKLIVRLGGISYSRTTQWIHILEWRQGVVIDKVNVMLGIPQPVWDQVKDPPEVRKHCSGKQRK
ncbi:uncharacterized protein L203_100712 [Cryptococcus depauperatus CBS 7841]|uniref:Uncharacterized protein n=1 Tax=Cryptococcus depauperatus CBS 7841 TaxID=1295531 RepID=A0AAJ8JNP3_9TREE